MQLISKEFALLRSINKWVSGTEEEDSWSSKYLFVYILLLANNGKDLPNQSFTKKFG